MSTFLPDRIIHFAADKCVAGDLPGLSPEAMRAVADIHERRGELLSAEQYRDMAEKKEAELWEI